MTVNSIDRRKTLPPGIQLLLCGFAGTIMLLLVSLIQTTAPPQNGEYYISSFFRNQFTLIAVFCFFIAGFIATYFLNWASLPIGIGLVIVYPVVSITESIVYRGSHNLIPLEFILFAFYSLPGFAAALAGKYLRRMARKRESSKAIGSRTT